MRSLENRRILVTGGSAGIGRAIAEFARDRGAKVVINGRDGDRLSAASDALDMPGVQGDVGDPDDAQRIVDQTLSQLGGLDVLVNNAAWGHSMTLENLDAEQFEAMWRSNVLGCTLMAKECLVHLEESQGDIVNIASTAGGRGYPGGSAYSSTKFALRGLTQCWQAELRRKNVRVMLVNPSEVQTGFGGADPDRPRDAKKLISEDIAHSVVSALEMDAHAFIPELTVFATNPWKEA